MARSCWTLLLAVVLAVVLVTPSHAQGDPTDDPAVLQQILNVVLVQINYCIGNASTPTKCPAIQPLMAAANISGQIQAGFTSADSPAGAPAPAPVSPYAACYNSLPDQGGALDVGLNPALILPFCNNTKCATAASELDTCITGVFDSIGGPQSPAEAPSPDSPEGSNSPDINQSIDAFCASPVCVAQARALTPASPPPPPGSAATVTVSLCAAATVLAMTLVGGAL